MRILIRGGRVIDPVNGVAIRMALLFLLTGGQPASGKAAARMQL